MHQSAFLRSLAEQPGYRVFVCANSVLHDERKRQGWLVPDFGFATVNIARRPEAARAILEDLPRSCIHLLGGWRGDSTGAWVLPMLLRNDARIGVLAEGADPRGLGGMLRRLKYRLDAFRLAHRLDFILAMGQVGVDWYAQCGFTRHAIFPFGYTAEDNIGSPWNSLPDRTRSTDAAEMIFVGSLIPLKGLSMLLEVLRKLKRREWTLTVVGDGPLRAGLERESATFAPGRIKFLGNLNNGETRSLIGQSDLLLLPSLKDGWGAVVNEALMAGTPAICSDACGSSVLLKDPIRGGVFSAGNSQSLEFQLCIWLDSRFRWKDRRQRVRAWSQCISGSASSRYFQSVLRHVYEGAPRPAPLWESTDE